MSRKATITQKEIVNAAFKITRKEGFEQITSRKLAAAAGCSTQPIFRIYENMDALKKDVYDKAAEYYESYITIMKSLMKFHLLTLDLLILALLRNILIFSDFFLFQSRDLRARACTIL